MERWVKVGLTRPVKWNVFWSIVTWQTSTCTNKLVPKDLGKWPVKELFREKPSLHARVCACVCVKTILTFVLWFYLCCYYHNISTIVPYSLHRVIVGPDDLKGISNWTLFILRRYIDLVPLSISREIIFLFTNAQLLLTQSTPSLSLHYSPQGLN